MPTKSAATMDMKKTATKTVYTPVFYATPQPTASTSSRHSTDISTSYLDSLSRKHIALAQIVEEIPGKDEGHESNERVELLRKQVIGAFELAKGEPADGKWTAVARLLQLRATRGRSRWLGLTKEGRAITSSSGWVNARTDSEWLEWEQKWKEEEKVKQKVESWKQKLETQLPPPSAISISDDSEGIQVELSLAKGKARASEDVDLASSSKKAPVKATATLLNAPGRDPRDPPALGFTVLKRSSLTTNGKPKHAAKTPANDNVAGPSKSKSTPGPRATGSNPRMKDIPEMNSSSPNDKPEKRKIADISEISFLPPSFPSQLPTSTPNDKTDRRQKPPPIPPIPSSSLLPSSPDIHTYGYSGTGLDLTSSLPEPPTTPKRDAECIPGLNHAKRQRSVTPEQVVKKARTIPPLSSSGGVVPPSTPPSPEADEPASSPMVITPKQLGKLPTLRELLASSKQTKHSPRKMRVSMSPPVTLNKGKAKEIIIEREASKEEAKVDNVHEPNAHLPFQNPFPLDDPFVSGLGVGLGYDAASPTKSLSSIAESDSDSDDGGLNLMHNLDDDFNPPFMSTQAQGKDTDLGLVPKGSSGFGWAGYSSQFDVNGKVDQINKFMEKDVDFNGWLRDPTPEVEESQW